MRVATALVWLSACCALTSLGCGARSGLSAGEGGRAVDSSTGGAQTTSFGASVGGSGGSGASGGSGGSGGVACVPATTDVFDPAEVYIVGTLYEGSADNDVVAHWCDANVAVAGFYSAQFSSATIRPSDGRLLYNIWSPALLREFRCDACPVGVVYPDDSKANDPELTHFGCDEIDGFLVSPDGYVITRCGLDAPTYFDLNGNAVYPAGGAVEPLLHLGHDGLALTQSYVVDLVSNTSAKIVGLPEGTILTVRAREGLGFAVALETADAIQLYSVAEAGSAVLLGVYPGVDATIQVEVGDPSARIDSSLALFHMGHRHETFNGVIVRRDLAGTSEVIYDEADAPLVKLHISYLITGP